MSWMLRLEDTRILHDPLPEAPVAVPVVPVVRSKAAAIVAPSSPPAAPNLIALLSDSEARVRRRAALAVGRVGLADGVAPLVSRLGDSDPEVRQMAAYAIGLIGDARGRDPLMAALADPALMVKASAAEALGLIGDPTAAAPIASMLRDIVSSGALVQLPPDAVDVARDTAAGAFRLGVYALVRLKAYDALAGAVLDPAGQPRVRWWPVAYALGRLEEPRALPALLVLLKEPQPYTRAFAAKGLGAMKDPAATAALLPLVGGADHAVAVEAIRSLARLANPLAAPPLLKLAQTPKADAVLRLEAVTALGHLHAAGVYDTLLDLLGDPSPLVRAATITSLAQVDPTGFVTILSGLDPDPNWTVRVALATALGTLAPEFGMPRLRNMLADSDARVLPAVLASIAKLAPPDAGPILLEHLKSADPVVREAAANGVATVKPPDGPTALTDAYQRSLADTTYVARGAVLAALRAYGRDAALPLLTDALADKDWAVRVRSAALLTELDSASDAAARIRPAPSQHAPEWYSRGSLTNPPISTHVYIDTDRGTIQIELAVLDAPVTVDTFVTLARSGFFDGMPVHRVVPDFVIQAGDPRGDGEGGPGFTIRNEINQRPYLRGTVGMALDWADTGGSQFFITHSPQPQLDDRYTVFGRVIDGMDVVDRIEPWDVIRQVRVWDGTTN
jgi:HEAT repeat protein/cyclophilin family peptidyl-prolyl cis-trans isomerase